MKFSSPSKVFFKTHKKTPATESKETPEQVFSCEFCESFKKTFLTEHFWRLLLISISPGHMTYFERLMYIQFIRPVSRCYGKQSNKSRITLECWEDIARRYKWSSTAPTLIVWSEVKWFVYVTWLFSWLNLLIIRWS